MGKSQIQPDVAVLGEHPSAYLAAALLRQKSKLNVVHITLPEERLADRLVLVNPALYELHPILEPLRRKIESRAVYGLQFLADEPGTAMEYRSRSVVSTIASMRDVCAAMAGLAAASEVHFLTPKQLVIHRLSEHGVELTVGNQPLYPKALVVTTPLPSEQQRLLGIPEEWERGVLHRYTFAKVRGTRWVDLNSRPLAPMSLDLKGMLSWAWLLPGTRGIQLAVEQSAENMQRISGPDLLRHWVDVLRRHGVLRMPLELHDEHIESLDLPLEGALAHEGVANRTLLVGPAGGFLSGSGEDVYPNCWSAVFAADVLKKALREPHLQDALQPYRQKWRTTLGEYLRSPKQNLRFLLPLVYRNQVMTDRLAEAILMGRSVVR